MRDNNDLLAFPNLDMNGDGRTGMTLRDYFAGQALMGFCVNYATQENVCESDLIKAAFRFADAMIAEREKEE